MKSTIHRPYLRFKGWLKEHEITYSDIALLLGISVTAVGFKINGKSDFTLSEIVLIRKKYNVEWNIFFTGDVA